MQSSRSNPERIPGRGRDPQLGPHPSDWRRITEHRRLAVLIWLYIAQAVAGSVIGFIAPFLYFFGLL
jgi:hypothetical protein